MPPTVVDAAEVDILVVEHQAYYVVNNRGTALVGTSFSTTVSCLGYPILPIHDYTLKQF